MTNKADANPGFKESVSPTFGTHGQLIIGEETIYLSHLPMFMYDPMDHPHNFQVILEVTLPTKVHTRSGIDPREIYVKDRQDNKNIRIYTVRPTPFDITDLVSDDPAKQLHSFGVTIFRGHFEHKGKPIVNANATIDVENVVHFHAFDPDAKKLPQLKYLLFGKGDELFIAHYITKPPDFDHILSVETIDHKFTDEELIKGISIVFPERDNTPLMRIKEGEKLSGEAKTSDIAEPLKLSLEAGTEFYFCADELAEPMTM
jgi:hypothetical protein